MVTNIPCYLSGSLRITNTERFIEIARQQHWAVIKEGDIITLTKGQYHYAINTDELNKLPSNMNMIKDSLRAITKQYTLNTIQALTRQKGWQVSSVKEDGNTIKIRIRS